MLRWMITAWLLAVGTVSAGEPLVRIGDAKRHVNHTDFLKRAVLFRDVGADNWRQVLSECQQGGFGILMSTWTEPGDFHTPWKHASNPARTPFADFAALKSACAAFRAAGIELQWHGYWNCVEPEGSKLLGFSNRGNPPEPWIDMVETVPVGRLTHDVSATDTQFVLDASIKNKPAWRHIAIENKGVPVWGKPWHYSIYAVGTEIVYCYNQHIEDRVMTRVTRGGYQTTRRAHPEGTTVALLPSRNGQFLKAGSAKQAQAVSLFADAYEQLGMSALYFDGWSGPNRVGENLTQSTENHYKRFIKPYVDSVDGIIQTGGTVPRAAGDRCRLSALGDAWWRWTKWQGDIDAFIADYEAILSRRPRNVPYRPQFAWLPLDGATTPQTLTKLLRHPSFRELPVCFQVLPSRNGVVGWDAKPEAERVALLALIKQLNEQRRE